MRKTWRASARFSRAPGFPERYIELMGHDKKVEGGRTRFILLHKIGEAFVADEVPEAVLRAALDYPTHV